MRDENVLIVSARDHTADSLGEALSEYDVTTVIGGKQALKTLKEKGFKVIFVDAGLSDISSAELYDIVRELCPRAFVILTSDVTNIDVIREIVKQDVFDFVKLPTDRHEVELLMGRLEEQTVSVPPRLHMAEEVAERQEVSRSPGKKRKPRSGTNLGKLQELTKAINSIEDLNELLDYVLMNCLSALASESGSIFLMDEKEGELVLKAAAGLNGKSILGTRQKLGEGISGLVAASGEPLLVTDITVDPRFKKERSDRYEQDSFLCVPLMEGEKLIGILNVTAKSSGEVFNDNDLKVLSILASHAAVAIGKIRLYQEKIRFNEELSRQVRKATRELRQSNERLTLVTDYGRAIVESIPQGLLVFDNDFKATFCNQSYAEMFGTDQKEVIGSSVADLCIGIDQSAWRNALISTLEKKEINRLEKISAAARQDMVIDITVSPFASSAGDVLGGLLVFEDRTENAKLEKLLAAAERQAVVGSLAARVAHELNNPLDGVLRFVNLSLARLEEDNPVKGYLLEAKMGLRRMANIVKALLIFSRKSDGISMEHATLNEVIRSVHVSLRHEAHSRRVAFTLQFCDDNPTVRGGDLHQVFTNLARNAFDSMPEGGALEVITESSEDTVRVLFRDAGCGIPDKVKERVFEPFFTTKDMGRGTGLGLAICRKIVERYNGTLTVESEVGQGSTFVVTLPLGEPLNEVLKDPE